MLEARADQQLVFHQHYQTGLRERVLALLTDELVESHRRSPHGPHGDAMMRVLVYFGVLSRYALYVAHGNGAFRLVRLPTAPGMFPEPVDAHEYADLGEARHALFLRNVAELRAEAGA